MRVQREIHQTQPIGRTLLLTYPQRWRNLAAAALQPMQPHASIDWAREWWYDAGSDLDDGRVEDVRRFVDAVSARSLRHYEMLPDAGRESAEPTL